MEKIYCVLSIRVLSDVDGVGSIFLRCIYPNACFEYYIEQFGVNKIFYSEMMIIV